MLELSLPSSLQERAVRIGERIARLQEPWPKPILLSASGISIYDCFPYLFEEAFPSIGEDDLDTFAVAARLYASSIFLHDKVFDQGPLRDAHSDLAPVNGMRIMAMQWESYRLLHGLFPPDRPFWQHFHRNLREFTSACLEEQRFAESHPWSELSQDLALQIAKGKNGIARTTIAGLAELQRDLRALPPLVEAIDCYNCARQMWDDLTDWREDLDAGIPSYLLARIVGIRPRGLTAHQLKNLKSEIGREIYYSGHASAVLQLALDVLQRADAALAPWPQLAWRKVHEDLRRECSLMLADIEHIVAENIRRSETQARFDLRLPAAQTDWQRLAWPAIEFIVQQWRQGFGEARHVMHFPPELGFTGPPYQRGDIFQRGIIADVLCDVADQWDVNLTPVIDHEATYLLSRRLGGHRGWSYFPELPELPPDADDLAQIMQLLSRSGRLHEIDTMCARPLSILFEDNCHPDGSLETWIIPGVDRTPEEERQAHFAHHMWGVGADPDVMANLLYAISLIGPNPYTGRVEKGVRYLLGRQNGAGSWSSTWYHGPYYGTYVCLRLLTRVCPEAENIVLAATFLRTQQNADGGWGSGESSNALDTALALLGLAHVQDGDFAEDEDLQRASKGLAFLETATDSDGTWPNHDFIRMDTGRAIGAISAILSYGSRTITTAFVLKSLAMWDELHDY